MHYRYYNPNPLQKSVGDCAVRAISAALNISWDESFQGIIRQAYEMADMPSSDSVWGAFLLTHGFKRKAIADTYPDTYTAGDFARDNPHGTFVLAFGGHVATIHNGILYDSWNSSNLIPVYFYHLGE